MSTQESDRRQFFSPSLYNASWSSEPVTGLPVSHLRCSLKKRCTARARSCSVTASCMISLALWGCPLRLIRPSSWPEMCSSWELLNFWMAAGCDSRKSVPCSRQQHGEKSMETVPGAYWVQGPVYRRSGI